MMAGLVWWTGHHIFDYNVYSSHDLDHHIARSMDALIALQEGHFPLRWAGSLNFNCGLPIFNFYYPLIYYLMTGLMAGGLHYLMAWKVINFVCLAMGAFGMWLWLRRELEDGLAVWTGAMLYLVAPYRLSLVYVRGTPEFLAYALFPVMLWLFAEYFERKKVSWLAAATLVGGLWMISHNMVVMLLTPLLILYVGYKWWIPAKQDRVKWYWVVASLVSMVGIGLWFWLPLLTERSLTYLTDADVFHFQEHFPTLQQLIRSPWGYFYSAPGVENDGMSFQLGYAQWLGMGIAGLMWLWVGLAQQNRVVLYSRGQDLSKEQSVLRRTWWVVGALLAMCGLGLYVMLEQSIWLWKALPILQVIQFPWRVLGVEVLLIAITVAASLSLLKEGVLKWSLVVLLLALAMVGNRNHLLAQPTARPERYNNFSTEHEHRYSMTTTGKESLPRDVEDTCHFGTPFMLDPEAKKKCGYEMIERGQTYGSVRVLSEATSVRLALTHFPEQYRVWVNDQPVDYESCHGYVCVAAGEGDVIRWRIVQTDIQRLSNWLTAWFVTVWVGLLGYGIYREVRGTKS